MMSGGMFMFGFGLIAMLLVIGLPVALIVVLIWALTRRGNSSAPVLAPVHQKRPVLAPALSPVNQSTTQVRACAHCGTALQADWSHCPQCGAQV